MAYPTEFVDYTQPVGFSHIDNSAHEDVVALYAKDFEVVAGVRKVDVPQITAIAGQTAVREYCPKDLTNRFGSEEMMAKWLQKGGGRGVFLLKVMHSNKIAGYGWTGYEPCHELPDHPITSAYRLSEDFQGQHLAAPFAKVIVAATKILYDERGVGLETWASNTPAVKTYVRAGAQLITPRDDYRPTLVPNPTEVDGMRRDVRLFMGYPLTNPVA